MVSPDGVQGRVDGVVGGCEKPESHQIILHDAVLEGHRGRLFPGTKEHQHSYRLHVTVHEAPINGADGAHGCVQVW